MDHLSNDLGAAFQTDADHFFRHRDGKIPHLVHISLHLLIQRVVGPLQKPADLGGQGVAALLIALAALLLGLGGAVLLSFGEAGVVALLAGLLPQLRKLLLRPSLCLLPDLLRLTLGVPQEPVGLDLGITEGICVFRWLLRQHRSLLRQRFRGLNVFNGFGSGRLRLVGQKLLRLGELIRLRLRVGNVFP